MAPKDKDLLKALQLMLDQQKKIGKTESDQIPSQTGSFLIAEGGTQTGGFLAVNDQIDNSINSDGSGQTGGFIAPIEVSFNIKSIFDGSINIDLSCDKPEFLRQSGYLEHLESKLKISDSNININLLKKGEL